jgi:hypothetical protein
MIRTALLVLLATAAVPAPARAAPVSTAPEAQLRVLQALDAGLASVATQLVVSNAALCRDLMPVTGLSLHARNQYPDALAGPVAAVFGFPAPLAVSAVVPGSPADRAGIRANDGVLTADELVPPAADTDGKPDTLVRDGFEAALAIRPATAPMVWRIRRGEQVQERTLTPLPGCRARFEVVPGQALIARNDGQLIQLSAGYVGTLSRAALAVIVAHELAHSVLLHRERLVAAGVSKGLLAEFGRHGRLNRQVEREADRLTVYLLRNAGFDPNSAVQFWEGPDGKRGGGLLRSRTHDSSTVRAKLIRAELAAMPPAPLPVVPAWLEERLRPLQ